MFDLSRLTDGVMDRLSGTTGTVQSELVDVLQNAGLDPAILDGLGPEDVSHLLAEFGIDPSAFDLGALTGGASSGILGALQDAMGHHRDL